MSCYSPRCVRTVAGWRLPTTISALCVLALSAGRAYAADRFWIDPLGGGFNTTSNWSTTDGGAGGASVPGAADVAIFTLNSTYTVTFSAAPTNLGTFVENGTVTLDLNGNTYTSTGASGIQISRAFGQTSRLTVTDGTLRVDTTGDDVLIGNSDSGAGFLTITTGGRLGDGTLRPDLSIGSEGAGTLTVNDNGRVDAGFAVLGFTSGSAGTMTITGPNAVVDLSTSLTVGATGAGTVNISNGGTLTNAGQAALGNLLGADGVATVTGAGSSWTSVSTLTIGSNGDGTLNVTNGGLVTSTGGATLGNSATGFGTATVTGANSRWDLSASQTIGSGGLGGMTISSGGQVVSTSFAILGASPGSEGRVTVTGAGARWTLGSGALNVGVSGKGDLTVSAGGEVSAPSMLLGFNGNGIGEAKITGPGSKLKTSGTVTVVVAGSGGTGTLNVADGGELNIGTDLVINDPGGAPLGTLNLDGGSIFVGGDFTNFGNFSFTDGLLQVIGNLQPSAAATALTINGGDSNDQPTLDLIGAGTTTNVSSLVVGNNHRGQLLLRQGRVLNVGGNTIGIGTSVGGEGTISVQSGAQLLSTGFLEVGGTLGGIAAGAGTLNVAGGTVDIGALELFADGTVNLSSGTLAFNSAPVLDGQFNWTGGTLQFDAAFSLTNTNVPKLLGLDATLNAGQALASAAGASVTLDTPIIVDGGALTVGNALNNNATLDIRSGSATVVGPFANNAGAVLRVERDLTIGTSLSNVSGARLELVGGNGRLSGAGSVLNDGLILGDGTITNPVTNNAAGKIRVDAGKTLFFTGALAPNAGELNLQGGTLDFSGPITNSNTGSIAGRGALYAAGLTNNGTMAFSGGNTDIHGDVTNNVGAVVTTGGGGVTTFFDDVVNQGQIRTNAGSRTVIFGAVSGAGSFPGTGTVEQLGDTRPGNSPAIVQYGGDLVLADTTRLFVEIGGTTPGARFDQVSVANSVFLDGTLEVTTINGFTPTLPGESFTFVTAGSRTGTFSNILGTPNANLSGLLWTVQYTPTSAILTTSALPGDIDLDGDVDRTDAALFARNYGTLSGAIWTTGDFDADGNTTLTDLALLQSHLGPPGSPSLSAAAVPEPSALLLMLLCGVCSVPIFVYRRLPRRST